MHHCAGSPSLNDHLRDPSAYHDLCRPAASHNLCSTGDDHDDSGSYAILIYSLIGRAQAIRGLSCQSPGDMTKVLYRPGSVNVAFTQSACKNSRVQRLAIQPPSYIVR